MMKDTMGLIYTVENGIDLKDLTQKRSIAAIPFGGRYRVIDFALSNMVNSGINNVGIITQSNYSSLMDYSFFLHISAIIILGGIEEV
jgi:glucose-1-phosphate adenylyltransferase